MRTEQYLTVREVEALFRVIKSLRDRVLFLLLYEFGLRSSEVGMLKLSDWNDQDGILKVHRKKNSIDQPYRLRPKTRTALRAFIRRRGNHSGPLFATQKGARPGGLGIARTHVCRLMQKYCEAAGIPREKASPRALRNAIAVHLRSEGGSAEVIRERLGHRAERSALVYFPRRRRRD